MSAVSIRFWARAQRLLFRLTSRHPLDVVASRAVERVRLTSRDLSPEIVRDLFYGATEIDPRYLTIWFAVRDDQALAVAQQQGFEALLRERTVAALRSEGYPAKALERIHVGLYSAAAADRAGGDYFYFK